MLEAKGLAVFIAAGTQLVVGPAEYLVETIGNTPAPEYTMGLVQGDCILGDVVMLKCQPLPARPLHALRRSCALPARAHRLAAAASLRSAGRCQRRVRRYWIVYDRANTRVGFAPSKQAECARSYGEIVAKLAVK
jgi:hypothetical protein